MPDHEISSLIETERTKVRRQSSRGSLHRDEIGKFLDEALVCQVGFNDAGTTYVLPSTFVRIEDQIYLHGALGNRMLQIASSGQEICVSVTLLDGLVLARSAFHHSMNYRSVLVLGRGFKVNDVDEKLRALNETVEHLARGRSFDARPPNVTELRKTLVVRVPIDEGSAKIRSGGPIDDPEDMELPIWAGQIPLATTAGPAIAEPDLPRGTEIPSYAIAYPDRTSGTS